MDRNFVSLYQDYIEGGLDRRGFLGRVAALAGTAAATTVVAPLAANAAPVALVLEKDPRIKIETPVAIPGGPDKLSGYLVTPTNINMTRAPAKMPAVLVVSENRSTNLNIQDVTRRFATEGYVSLAVDYLSPFGGRPVDEEVASVMTAKLKPEDVMACFQAGLKYLRARPDVGKIAVVGFGWGGALANQLAMDPLVAATVVFYGRNPDLAQVSKIKGPLLGHYAGLDGNILQGIPAYDAALTKAGKPHSFYIYPGANTGFVNENNAARWDPVATQLSWDRSVAFLSKYMG